MRIDKGAYKKAVDETMEMLKDYNEYCRFVELAGTSHLSARNLAAVLHSNRDAEEVGTLMYWNKRRRIIKPKEKGIKILVPSSENPKDFVGGVVFDVKQTMPSEKAIQQGEKEYRHTYPYSGSKEGFQRFQDDFQRGISEVRVAQSSEINGASTLKGALITVNTNLQPDKEARAVLLEYARYVMGKNIAHIGETDQSNFDKEFKAVTMASIMGRRMGFKMDDPKEIAYNPTQVFSWENRTVGADKLLSDAVSKANKALFQISREFFKAREAQQDLNLNKSLQK